MNKTKQHTSFETLNVMPAFSCVTLPHMLPFQAKVSTRTNEITGCNCSCLENGNLSLSLCLSVYSLARSPISITLQFTNHRSGTSSKENLRLSSHCANGSGEAATKAAANSMRAITPIAEAMPLARSKISAGWILLSQCLREDGPSCWDNGQATCY